MVTLMVKLRKLTGNLITFVAVTRGKSVLQTNGLLEGTSVFGRFWATKSYQISPLFAKNVHRRGSNTALRAGFARPIQLKRVKPSGPCQSVIGAHFAIAKERPTQRHRGTEKNGKHWGARDIFVSSSVSLGLGASVVILHALSRPFRRSAGATANLRGQSVDSTMVDRQFSKSEKHGMLNLKDLLAGLSFHPASVEPDLSGLAGPLKRGAAYLLIPQGLLAKLLRRTGEVSLNLKDLLAMLPATLFGPFGVLSSNRNWRCQSTDSARVVGRIVEESGRRSAQSKGLTNRSPADGWGGLFGFVVSTEMGRGRSADSARVAAQVAEESEGMVAQSKGFAKSVSADP